MPFRPTALLTTAVIIGGGALVLFTGAGGKPLARASQPQTPALAGSPPELVLPIDCEPGSTCAIQSYTDHDPGPEARDYRCLGQTYNDHKGTDFRIPSLAAAASTTVLAAAPGTVQAVRSTVPDHRIGAIDLGGVDGIECGNGVVIDHGAGWETQYCHMAEGSIAVAAGDSVVAGQQLGTVGLSGNTEFAHLHFSVRHAGDPIDPFAGTAAPLSCEEDGTPLWRADVASQLGYTRSVALNTGFAPGAVSMDQIEGGAIDMPEADSPALVAWARAINLRQGDVLSLQMLAPNGSVLAQTSTEPMDRNKAQWMLFTGRRLRRDAWPAGRYTGRLTLTDSNGEAVLERQFTMAL